MLHNKRSHCNEKAARCNEESQQHGGAGCRRGRGAGAASGAPSPGAPAPAPGQALAPAPIPAAASQFTLLVMHPCGGQDEAAAETRPAAGSGPGGAAPGRASPFGTCAKWRGMARRRQGKTRQTCWTRRTPGGGESMASLEDLEDEETHSGGEGGSTGTRSQGSGRGRMSKACTYEGCSETTSQVAKQRKLWMCKKHRNKMYKDKHKKKKSDQALNCEWPQEPAGGPEARLKPRAQRPAPNRRKPPGYERRNSHLSNPEGPARPAPPPALPARPT
ncbi:hypothetical protein J1605_009080 [Eschrichtius robustus]|uniref:Regulatory factor X-associated protein RFXANK-binding domain-containing protein n=1 Tax=Eschrichtius robustus TaxID=9764 RepID=A0AB34GU78_ESCRO|nr:hypothetical protein J1605_009080 [Eschrichtius robustus]